MITRSTVYFARPDALSGSIVETLKHVKPDIFFAVPRVYEKFEDKIRDGLDKASFIKKKIGKLSILIFIYILLIQIINNIISFFYFSNSKNFD